MLPLSNTKIYRGGVTAPSLTFETTQCDALVDPCRGTLDFNFSLASKGGGTTSVRLEIGKGDFAALLQEIANTLPDSAGVLSDSASIANKKNIELLEAARKVHASKEALADSMIEVVESIGTYVTEKHYKTSVGEDENEERVLDLVEKVISSLRELR
jgi:hypothetical protein